MIPGSFGRGDACPPGACNRHFSDGLVSDNGAVTIEVVPRVVTASRVFLALLAVSLVAGACGAKTSTSQPGGPAGAALQALTKMPHVSSFRLTWNQTAGPQPIQQYNSLSGVVDLAGRRLKLTAVGMSGPTATVGPGGTPSPTNSATTTIICIGAELWFSNALTPNEWLHQTIPAGKEIAGLPVGNPSQVFSTLKMHLTGISAVGKQLVDGVETSHYRGAELLQEKRLRWNTRVDMWIDATGLARQLKIEATTHFPAVTTGTGVIPGGSDTETISAHLFDFDVRSNIEPPPLSEVTND